MGCGVEKQGATVEGRHLLVKADLLEQYNLSGYKDQMPSPFLHLIWKLFANYICETHTLR